MSERPDSLPVNIWELLSARHADPDQAYIFGELIRYLPSASGWRS